MGLKKKKNINIIKKNGFTLIELMATILIVSIVLALGYSFFGNVISTSNKKADSLSKDTIIRSAKIYLKDNNQVVWEENSTFVPVLDLMNKGYLKNDTENYQDKCVLIVKNNKNESFDSETITDCSNSNKIIGTIPKSSNICKKVIYTGSSQTIAQTTEEHYILKNTIQTDAGKYGVIASLKENYIWIDGSNEDKIIYCNIQKATPNLELNFEETEWEIGSNNISATSSVNGTLTLKSSNKKYVTAEFEDNNNIMSNTKKMIKVNVFASRNINTAITVTLNPNDSKNYKKISEKFIVNELNKKIISSPKCIDNLRYNGKPIKLIEDSSGYRLINNEANNFGKFTITAKLNYGYIWSDGTNKDKNIICEVINNVPPTKPVITRKDYNTFTYTSTDDEKVTGYYVTTMTNVAPILTETISSDFEMNVWTTSTNTGNLNLQEKTYYVWARDAAGNLSEAGTIGAYTVTRSQGTGSTLTTRYDSTSKDTGTAFTSNKVVLAGTNVWSSATEKSGYETPILKYGSNTTTNPGYTKVNGNLTISSSASIKGYTVTLIKGTGISTVTGAGKYQHGSSVTINTTLLDQYIWKNWTGTSTQTSQSYTFTITSDVTLTANAGLANYKISDSTGKHKSYEYTLGDAFSAASNQDTITLLRNYTDSSIATANKAGLTLNTNGKTLTRSGTITVTKKLTVTGSGTVTCNDAATFTINGAEFFVNGPHITNTSKVGNGTCKYEVTGTIVNIGFNTIYNKGGTVNVSSGILSNVGDEYETSCHEEYVIHNNSGGTVNITGGEIRGHGGVYLLDTSVANLDGGTMNIKQITAKDNRITSCALASDYEATATINIKSGIINTDNYAAGNYNESYGVVNITGGTINGTGERTLLHNVCDANHVGTINISGGTITHNGNGIVVDNKGGKLNITGGKITSKSNAGAVINARNASVTKITAGTIEGVSTGIHVHDTSTLEMGNYSTKSTAKLTVTGQSTAVHCGSVSNTSKATCYFGGATIKALNTTAANGIWNNGGDVRIYQGTTIHAKDTAVVNRGTYSSGDDKYYARVYVRQGILRGGLHGIHSTVAHNQGVYVGYKTDTIYTTYSTANTGGGPVVLGDTSYGVVVENTSYKYQLNNGVVGGAGSPQAGANVNPATTRSGYAVNTTKTGTGATATANSIKYYFHRLKTS